MIETEDLKFKEKTDERQEEDSMSCRAISSGLPDYTELRKKGRSVTPEEWKDIKYLCGILNGKS